MNNSSLRSRWQRRLAFASAILFPISSVFPIVAGLSKDTDSIPKWWGPLDVAIAFVLAAVVIAMLALVGNNVSKQNEDSAYRVHRVLLHGIPILLLLFFLAGDRIVWIRCLTGFAWRAWFLLYALPSWLAALRSPAPFREDVENKVRLREINATGDETKSAQPASRHIGGIIGPY